MTWKTVERYSLGYDIQLKQFYVYYELEGDSTPYQISARPDEFLGLSDMFRNEGPIRFNVEGRYLVTSSGPVGDGEDKLL
jgi:hypothetical protein